MKEQINYIDAPTQEPERQYYFIEQARAYVKQASEDAGRPLTFCVTTFGCPTV